MNKKKYILLKITNNGDGNSRHGVDYDICCICVSCISHEDEKAILVVIEHRTLQITSDTVMLIFKISNVKLYNLQLQNSHYPFDRKKTANLLYFSYELSLP